MLRTEAQMMPLDGDGWPELRIRVELQPPDQVSNICVQKAVRISSLQAKMAKRYSGWKFDQYEDAISLRVQELAIDFTHAKHPLLEEEVRAIMQIACSTVRRELLRRELE